VLVLDVVFPGADPAPKFGGRGGMTVTAHRLP
jgi:hypothetical protein